MSEYTKQAKEFLNKYNISIAVKFLKNDYHFSDDKEKRDIFYITFTSVMEENKPCIDRKPFSLTFGHSIANSTGKGTKKPTSYDVLACITKSDPGSFEDFCSEFGYNIDSRKAEKIYKSVVEEYEHVNNFFTETEIEELQEIN